MRRTAWLAVFLAGSLLSPAVRATPAEDPPAEPAPAAAEPAPAAVAPAPAPADDALPGVDDLLARKAEEVAQAWPAAPAPAAQQTYPWFEHHGYFRLRLDGFWRPHLGTEAIADGTTVNTSSYRPPLNANAKNNNPGEDWLGGANMRLRWAPTLHVARSLSIRTEVDILDNIVLGSNPDADPDRADSPLPVFSRGQAPASATTQGGRDPVSVKQAYMVWTPILPRDDKGFLMQFTGGRMARHWGLGLVENAGRDLDADWGTYADRVNLLTRIGGIYAELGYGWVSSGPSTADPTQPFGEPGDLSNADDVFDVSLAVFKRPDSESERQARYRRLVVQNKAVLDGGAYLIFRRQNLDVVPSVDGTVQSLPPDAYDDVQLERRDAWMLTPDLWLKLEWKPSLKEHVRIELEAAGVYGHVANVPRFRFDKATSGWVRDGQGELDILSFGAALEGEYTRGPISTGLYAGIATGTDAPYWGWRDRSNVTTNKALKTLNSFYFHPDYRVDQLMFRHAVGTVTNAWYVKPFIQYDLFEGDQDALAGRLEVLYARALSAKATPGRDPDLGVELDVKLFYEEKGSFFVGLDWATLFPFDGFDLPADYGCAPDGDGNAVACHKARNARWSMAIRGRFGVMF